MSAPASTVTICDEPPRGGIPIYTLICAALVGVLMWLAAFWITRAAWVALTAAFNLMEL